MGSPMWATSQSSMAMIPWLSIMKLPLRKSLWTSFSSGVSGRWSTSQRPA